MGPFEQRGCAIRQAAPRCSNPEIAGAASDISNERKLRLVYRVLTLAAGQVEGDDRARGVRFRVDFRGEAAARTPERLTFLPPFAPAAET